MASVVGNVPIAITGMHRSGTSMITRALHDSGLHLIGAGAEELIDAAEDNPEGFWENKAIVACNDDLLEATAGAWDNPPELPPQAVDDPRVHHVAEAATTAIAALSEHEHWGFKDPRICLTAAYWLDLLPDLRFIVCVRHPLEVALSLKRRNQNSYSLGLALWERYYASVLEVIPADRRLVTHYDTFFVDPEGEIARLCAFAGLEPAPPRVRADLRHHTIGVGFDDAGVSTSLRALYADLCREAGAALAPEPPPDEGRVRRLILDGAVAARHADQRQDAVDRLDEREAQFQAEHRDRIRRPRGAARLRTEGGGRSRRRDARADELGCPDGSARRPDRCSHSCDGRASRDRASAQGGAVGGPPAPAAGAEPDPTSPARRSARGRGSNSHCRYRGSASHPPPTSAGPQAGAPRPTSGRSRHRRPGAYRASGRSQPRTVGPVHGEALPPPAQRTVRGARAKALRLEDPFRRLVRRVIATGRRSAGRSARVAVHRLPPDAQRQVRRVRRLVRRGVADPVPTAKAVGLRLPPPARRVARRAWRAARRLRAGGAAQFRGEGDRRPAAPPKGPALRQWKDGYERMVAAAIPDGAPWLVVLPGSPSEVRDARAPRATPFPSSPRNRPFADDLAHIAHLEALRFEGYRHLVLPEGSRPWFRQRSELRDHVMRTYRTVVDEESAGAVFDLFETAVAGTRSLRGEVDRLSAELPHAPAVLDWTALALAGDLPGEATFTPPPGDRLPYLDRSVEIVVVDRTHDVAEARRVASHGVITVAAGATGIDVRDVEDIGTVPGTSGLRVLVWSNAADSDDAWRAHLAERAAEAGADVRFAEIDAAGLVAATNHDVVVVVEPHVLPLPGAIEAAAALAASMPDTAIAGKVLRADGRLESAGGTVFSDRSVALIAGTSTEVRASVARVCHVPSAGRRASLPPTSSLWAAVPAGVQAGTGRSFLREWCAEVWAHGGSVVYQPTVAAVRVTGDGGEASVPLHSSSWQRVLDLRPARPADLTDGAWRYLLAHDDVEACRR